jgi:hypothetical protein
VSTGCAGPSGRNPVGPSASESGSAITVQAAANGATTVSFSGFNAATLAVNINTTTTSAVGQPYIDGGKIQLEILVNASGNPVPCGTAGASYVRLDHAGGGGANPSGGATSQNFDLDNLDAFSGGTIHNVGCGAQICIRAHYITGGGQTHVDTHFSSDTPYTIVCPSCTSGQGFWKNHYPDSWPVTSLTLGTVSYSASQLEDIFNTPVGGPANGLISLAHQLIAAKLNVARGAPAPAEIAGADALIGGLVVPPVGSGYLAPSAVSSLVAALDAFNNSAPCASE